MEGVSMFAGYFLFEAWHVHRYSSYTRLFYMNADYLWYN